MDPATAAICKCYGKPSPDGNLRLYTKEECDLLGGEWYPNGECIKPEGGSFSYDCRFLNTEPCPEPPAVPASKKTRKVYKIKLTRKDGSVETVTASSVEIIETTKNTTVFKA